MQYCPFCSASLGKSTQVCPECNNSLDIALLSHLYHPGETSGTDRSTARKIWLREHAFTVLPIIGIIIGLIAGFIIAYGYLTLQVASERTGFEERINALQDSLILQQSSAGSAAANLQENIKNKEEIIKLLNDQIDILVNIISFTRRFATNSTLSTLDEAEIDYFRRNVFFLINQYKEKQTQLEAAGQNEETTVNLFPVPQIFE
jgi:hypothetical protein